MDIYLMYLRKSRADNENETVEEVLARHERILQNLAVKILGHLIPEKYIYREIVSGETIDARPQMKRLLLDIESSDVKGVFVVEPQRLTRGDWEDGGKLLSSFRYSNTLIYTPNKTYNLFNKFDYKFFKMELSQGNDYLEYTKEILARGRISSVKEGNYIGSVAPYGYKKVIIDKSPTLEIVEDEAKAIQLATKMFVEEGVGWTAIGEQLESLGFFPRKSLHWSPYCLRDICRNPVNIGKVKWNSRKCVTSYENGKLTITRPRNSEPLYFEGKHEPILDVDLYNKLLDKLGTTSRNRPKMELKNPFSSLLRCGTCGKSMVYREYTKNGVISSAPRLLCNNQKYCCTKSATFEAVYNAVIDSLNEIVKNFYFELEQQQMNNDNMQEELLEKAKQDLGKLEKKQENLYDLLEDKVYTKEIFLKRTAKLNDERKELEKRIELLTTSAPPKIDYESKISAFTEVIHALEDNSISAKNKNDMLKTILSCIYYYRDTDNRTKWDKSNIKLKILLKDF